MDSVQNVDFTFSVELVKTSFYDSTWEKSIFHTEQGDLSGTSNLSLSLCISLSLSLSVSAPLPSPLSLSLYSLQYVFIN